MGENGRSVYRKTQERRSRSIYEVAHDESNGPRNHNWCRKRDSKVQSNFRTQLLKALSLPLDSYGAAFCTSTPLKIQWRRPISFHTSMPECHGQYLWKKRSAELFSQCADDLLGCWGVLPSSLISPKGQPTKYCMAGWSEVRDFKIQIIDTEWGLCLRK